MPEEWRLLTNGNLISDQTTNPTNLEHLNRLQYRQLMENTETQETPRARRLRIRSNPIWLEAINQTLSNRGHDHLLASITDSLWERYIEPMIEALEAGAFDGPDVTMRKRKRLGYQVVDGDDEMPDGWVSFGIYSLADCRRAINEDKTRWQLVTIFDGDIEEPTFMKRIR